MKNITNVLSDQFKEIQSELTTQFRSICDETNRNMFRVQFEVTRDINLMRSDFYQKISNMRKRMDEIQQMVEIIKKSLSISPSTSFMVSENKNENYKTSPKGSNPLLPSSSRCPNPEPQIQSNHQTKPQCFEGSEDLDEYLAQFEILSKLNRWEYHQKSLHLASSLKGNVRAILSELSNVERRDYNHLEKKALTTRFGSQGRAEIYRAQIQIRIRNKDETISELAQSIKKLTRRAYPDAPSSLTKILSLDHFIDVIPESDMRLRIREAHPKRHWRGSSSSYPS